jgi:hypothetical protein
MAETSQAEPVLSQHIHSLLVSTVPRCLIQIGTTLENVGPVLQLPVRQGIPSRLWYDPHHRNSGPQLTRSIDRG